MPRTTIADACRKRGIDRADWDEAKRQGIDPWVVKDMEKWLKKKRHRIKPGTSLTDTDSSNAQTLDEIEDAIRKAKDIDTVRILKEKVMALKGIVAVQQETRELVPSGEVRESMTAVYSVVRAEMLKLTSDLPPQIAGLGEAKIQSILRTAIVDILTRLSDSQSKLFTHEDSK
jgi:hypothetical protein